MTAVVDDPTAVPRSLDATHVFVLRGDVTHLACDAWLLPTDSRLSFSRAFARLPGLQNRLDATDTDAFRRGDVRSVALAGGAASEPTPVLTAVPLHGVERAADLVPAVTEFLHVAASAVHPESLASRTRSKPLVALPLFGTAGGGGVAFSGQILSVLLDTAHRVGSELDIDVALVLQDEGAYALAQHLRMQQADAWRALPPELRHAAEGLSDDARSGRLVPFMGAGTSITAGGPLWKDLIERLGRRMGMSDATVDDLGSPDRNVLDQAAVLRAVFSRQMPGAHFNDLVAEETRLPRYGVTPLLLAALPAKEAITLNYDLLFETAASDARLPRRVIPVGNEDASHDRRNERWLLKLHGTVDDPSTIVLTRDDYLGFQEDRAALTSLVKAMLMTRHLLFVGFGFADDHFHEILFDVRRAVRDQGVAKLRATAVKLQSDPLDELLTDGDLQPLVIDPGRNRKVAENARTLEVFLDALLCFASGSHSYLLRPEFEQALTPPELRLRERLLQLIEETGAAERDTVAWQVLAEALSQLGARTSD